MIEISVLPEPESHPLWPSIHALLEVAARRTGSFVWEPEHIVWLVIEDRQVIAAVTTRITEYWDAELWHIAGCRAAEWLPAMSDLVCAWARDCGADRITCQGRKGWARLSEPLGWRVYRKDCDVWFYEKVL